MVRVRVSVCVGLGLGMRLREGKPEPPSHSFPSLSHVLNPYRNLTLTYTLSLTLAWRGGLVVSTLCSQPIHDGFESWSCTSLCHHVISLGKEFTHIAQVNSAYYQLDGK